MPMEHLSRAQDRLGLFELSPEEPPIWFPFIRAPSRLIGIVSERLYKANQAMVINIRLLGKELDFKANLANSKPKL